MSRLLLQKLVLDDLWHLGSSMVTIRSCVPGSTLDGPLLSTVHKAALIPAHNKTRKHYTDDCHLSGGLGNHTTSRYLEDGLVCVQ